MELRWGVRQVRHFRLAVASFLVIGMLLGPGAPRMFAGHAGTFPANATGLAVSPSRFLIATCNGDEVKIQSVSGTGALSDLAQTPADDITGCLNPSIAIAPWTAGFVPSSPPYFPLQNAARFAAGFGYFTQTTSTGTTIWQVDLAGTLTPLVSIADCAGPAYADLLFQTVEDADPDTNFQGPFGPLGTLFITCTTGKIWKITNATTPVPSLVKDLLTVGIDNIQGPSQAPRAFSPAPGALCVASPTESNGRVFCVQDTLEVATVGSWPDVNGVDFLLAKCTYEPGTTGSAQGGMYYVSTPQSGGTIFKYTPPAFSGLVGNAAIATRAGTNQPSKGLGKLTTGGISPFDTHPGIFHRDATPVECGGPTTVTLDVSPGQAGTNFNQFAKGTVVIAIVGSAVVPATSITPASVRCGLKGIEAAAVRWQIKDNTGPKGNPDGTDDWVGWFERPSLGLQDEPSPYRGKLVCTGAYTVGADPPFGGDG